MTESPGSSTFHFRYPDTARYLQGAFAVGAFCLALIVIAWWLTGNRVRFEREEAIRAAAQQNANLALAYDEHITRALRGVDHAVSSMKRALEMNGAQDPRSVIDAGAEDTEVSTVLGFVDRDGYLVGRKGRGARTYLGDRDYFRVHRDTRSDDLVIGHAVKGRITGEWAIPVSRRVDAPDGSFRGVILAAMRPDYFTRFYGRADLGADGVVTIIGLDGTSLVRRTRTASTLNVDMRDTHIFAAHRARPESGTVVTRGRIEGVPRVFSYRQLRDYPVIVAVGTSLAEVLAGPDERRREYRVAAASLTALALAFLGIYLLIAHRHRASITALIRSERALTASQRIAQLGSWEAELAENGDWIDSRVKWSDEIYRILGYGTDDVRPSADAFLRVVHPDDAETVRRAVRRAVESCGVFDIQHRIVSHDGTVKVVHCQGQAMRDPSTGRPVEMIGTVRDVTEQKALEEQLLQQANYDELTGLPNRRLFHERLQQAVTLAEREGRNVAALFVDVDKFKAVNDTLGHTVGDELLHEVARRLSGCVRAQDTIARLGGDEFAVILHELADSRDAAEVAGRMIQALEAPAIVGGHELMVTASIGIASYPSDSPDAASLMKNADTAMYRAKELGPNRYEFYSGEMNARALSQLLMVAQLKRALERDELRLVYQPRFEGRTGRMTGCEALMRWVRDGEEVAPPAEFVPLLETSGLILPVGEWIVATICRQLRSWMDAGLNPVPVAFNASARQFEDCALTSTVRRALETHRLPASLLDMEITESTIMHRPQESEAIIGRLREAGMKISIDDFGTGYSSLSRLKRFPITSLKIDRTFVDGLPDSDDASITRAIITMAHSLHLTVVAEGVETRAQYEFLLNHHCDEMQGFFFMPPVSAEVFADRLRVMDGARHLADRAAIDLRTGLPHVGESAARRRLH